MGEAAKRNGSRDRSHARASSFLPARDPLPLPAPSSSPSAGVGFRQSSCLRICIWSALSSGGRVVGPQAVTAQEMSKHSGPQISSSPWVPPPALGSSGTIPNALLEAWAAVIVSGPQFPMFEPGCDFPFSPFVCKAIYSNKEKQECVLSRVG